MLEEIVVTAQKRTESLIEVPVAVSVFTGAGSLSFPALEVIFGLPAGSIFANGTGTRNEFDYSASGFAVFAQGTYHLNDQWSITDGLRNSDEEKDSTATNSLANEPFSQVLLPAQLCRAIRRRIY